MLKIDATRFGGIVDQVRTKLKLYKVNGRNKLSKKGV